MADDSKKDIKSNNIANADTGNSSAGKAAKDSKKVDTPVAELVGNSNLNKGGEQAMAKDPEGMFDYSKCPNYTVKKDETLFDVAQKNNVALQQLRYFNHLNKATWKIKEGQALYIPREPIHVPAGE